jgi:5-methylcytosine-specific restriction endonuclease McrA
LPAGLTTQRDSTGSVRMSDDALADGKHCKGCDSRLPVSRFNRDNASRDGLTYRCKDCVRKNSERYYKKNRERIQSRVSTWLKDNPERRRTYQRDYYARSESYRAYASAKSRKRAALKALLPSETVLLREIALRDGATCWMCGDELSEWNPAHLDHLVPLSADTGLLEAWGVENPGTVRANMALACPTCNIRKSNRLMPCALARYLRNLSAESEIAA